MSLEGSSTISLKSTQAGTVVNLAKSITFDVSTNICQQDVLVVPVSGSPATIPFVASITSPAGRVMIYNNDSTNTISLGLASGSQEFATIPPGQCAYFKPKTNTIYWWSSSASLTIQATLAAVGT